MYGEQIKLDIWFVDLIEFYGNLIIAFLFNRTFSFRSCYFSGVNK